MALFQVTFYAEITMLELQRFPYKRFLIKYELDLFNCLVLFVGSLQKWQMHFLRNRNKGEIHWNKHFQEDFSEKNNDIFHIFNQIKVSRSMV